MRPARLFLAAPQIVTKVYDLILHLVSQISKFPKSQRYLLGDRLEMATLDVLESFIEAMYRRDKTALLQRANVKLEMVRYHIRLCKDLRLIDFHRYEVLSRMVNEIGVQLGGWIKQQKS